MFLPELAVSSCWIKANVTEVRYLCLGWRVQGGRGSLVPPGQRGTEPLDFAQVDEEGAIRAVHTVKGVARVRGPSSTHPLEGKEPNCYLSKCEEYP